MWEDVRNRAGGRWLVNLEKKDRREVLDKCWLETVSMCSKVITPLRAIDSIQKLATQPLICLGGWESFGLFLNFERVFLKQN